MNICTNETIEYTILFDNYKPSEEEVREIAQKLWEKRPRRRADG